MILWVVGLRLVEKKSETMGGCGSLLGCLRYGLIDARMMAEEVCVDWSGGCAGVWCLKAGVCRVSLVVLV